VGRAYARRAGRARRLAEGSTATGGRTQFVLSVMALLVVGMVASLWLSTTAAADSYRLDAARRATRDLAERTETLRTEIAGMQAAPTLARLAEQIGMVRMFDVARLVPRPDGSVAVIGTPKAAPTPVATPPPVGVPVGPTAPAVAAPAAAVSAGSTAPAAAVPTGAGRVAPASSASAPASSASAPASSASAPASSASAPAPDGAATPAR
jgi:cell division protein FtsI (penicillin-binding protein 3)